MPENNSILEKLDGLEARYEEVSTLITDPAVIADQQRYVKLTKEYKDLDDIMKARKRYIDCLNAIKEAKDILANEKDPDMKEMAREELSENENLKPQLEEDIKCADEEGTNREIELTSALEAVRSRVGMIGVRLYSQRFDMGNPTALVDTVSKFSHL